MNLNKMKRKSQVKETRDWSFKGANSLRDDLVEDIWIIIWIIWIKQLREF